MKRLKILFAVAFIATFISCDIQEKETEDIISKHTDTLASDVMTPEVMWMFGRISDVQLSPDKSKILYGVSYYDLEKNKGNRELFIMNADGSEKEQLTQSKDSEYNALWLDNERIVYMAKDTAGQMQIFEMPIEGKTSKQISFIEGGITGFSFSPDASKLVFTQEVNIDSIQGNLQHKDLPLANAYVVKDLMYRHWDRWVESYSHLFFAEYNGDTLSKGIDLMYKEPFDFPMKPFWGFEQLSWHPDGNSFVYSCKKSTGLEYTLTTNSDIYWYDLKTKVAKNLTTDNFGYDLSPVFSHDGKKIAWVSMERNGYESDKHRLFVLDLETGEKNYYTKDFDQNADNLIWSADDKKIYFISDWHATDEIYCLNLEEDSISQITDGIHNYHALALAKDKIIACKQSMSQPTEIYAVDLQTGKDENISMENAHLLDQLTMGEVEKRWVTTTDNKEMLVWVIYPPHFDSTKVYPALLYCQGGPQGTVSQFWSYRWNFQMMAANDYIVVAPNRRGLPGFGQEWLEQISGDYGGQNMKDYLSAIDAVKQENYIDENRLGAVGASYGGFSVYWLAGNHDGRFSAFIAHDGMFNLEAQYLETEEMWFVNWDLGGAFWDKDNPTAQRSYANSLHKFVDKWDTPIMVIHGEKDYRIVYSQGMSAFNAAQLRGIPSKYLHFPTENHWVLQPQNAVLWQREFFSWLDQWLKEEKQ